MGQEHPLEQEISVHTSIPVHGKFHGQKILAEVSPRGHKESDMTDHTHRHN